MRIVCLVNGGDSLIAYHHTLKKYPEAEVIAVNFDLGLPYSKTLLQFMPNYVLRDSFGKFKDSMKTLDKGDGNLWCNEPYEPLIWMCVVKHRADKVVLGVVKGDSESEQETEQWLSRFNEKFSKDMVEFPLAHMTKREALDYAITLGGCITPALDLISCRSIEPGIYGCGNCSKCLRKRTAITSMGRISRIPAATKISYYAKAIIGNYSIEALNGTTGEELELAFNEIAPSLEELLGSDDPHKMAKRMNRFLRD